MRRGFIKFVLVALVLGPAAVALNAYALTPTSNSKTPTGTSKISAPPGQKAKAPVVIPADMPDIAPTPVPKTVTAAPIIKPNISAQTKQAAPQSLTTSSDTTQPVGPTTVTASSEGLTNISASWDAATDPESGVTEYVFGIGTIASGNYNTLANVRYWQVVLTNSFSVSLSLDPSQTYYVSVYAINGAGLSGSIVTSAGIHPVWTPLGQSTNNVSIAFAPTGLDASGNVIAGFTPAQITTMTNFYNNFYPLLKQLYGPPAVNYTVTIVRDLAYTNSNEFFPSDDTIHMSDTLYPQLFVHEFVHAFREKYILSSDANWNYDPTLSGFEEGFAQAVSYEVMNLYTQTYPNDTIVAGNTLWGSSMDWDYDYQNVPELRGTNFWSDGGGTLLYWTRYEMAAAAIRKINLESPGFYAAFNAKYYSLINANPTTVRPSQALITSIIAGITPTIEGVPAATWIGQQNVFYDQNVYGDKIFHQIQDYPYNDYFAFQNVYFLDTMSCGSEWACYDGTQWDYYNLNGTTGTASLTDDNGNTVWSGSLQIQPTTNPAQGNYVIGDAPMGMTTASTLQPWPGGDPSTYIMNLDNFGLYKFNTTFTDPNTGVTTSNSVYRVFGSQIANNFKGVWGGIIGHKNGTIYLNHVGYPTEPGIPVVNGAFAGTRLWASIPDARTGGIDSVPGKVMVSFVDSDTGATYQAQRNIDYGSSEGNQMFLFDFSGPGTNADTTPPTVSVSAPAAGATVYGTTTLTANASDNVGVSSVQFLVDGTNLGSQITSAPYSLSWNSAGIADGSHTIQAVAIDAAGNRTTSAPVTIKVANNPPSVSLTAPTASAVVTGSVPVTASVTSNSGLSKVEFYRDGTTLIGTATTSPYSVNWSTTGLVQGSSHTLSAKAYALNGTTTTSSAVTVFIKDTTAPTVSITAPANNTSTSAASVSLAATAADNIGVTKVEFYIDGNLLATDTSKPYSTTWTTTAATVGSHAITAKAYDQAGNVTTSATISIKITDTTAPKVSITAPANNSQVTHSTTVSIAATASDNKSVAKVEFYVNNVLKCTDTTASYSCAWAVPSTKGTKYTLMAKAYDGSGNTATSSVTVTSK